LTYQIIFSRLYIRIVWSQPFWQEKASSVWYTSRAHKRGQPPAFHCRRSIRQPWRQGSAESQEPGRTVPPERLPFWQPHSVSAPVCALSRPADCAGRGIPARKLHTAMSQFSPSAEPLTCLARPAHRSIRCGAPRAAREPVWLRRPRRLRQGTQSRAPCHRR
jgi:hypothetical protein